MRPTFTLSLVSLDDTQHVVTLIDVLNQFAHAGTISAPTDNTASADTSHTFAYR